MAKYRKKPIVIEAVRYEDTTEGIAAVLRFCPGAALFPDHITIKTREGTMRADLGDYIIRGIQGEFYPCEPDIFEATYEAVEG